jgi:hypothetical protein
MHSIAAAERTTNCELLRTDRLAAERSNTAAVAACGRLMMSMMMIAELLFGKNGRNGSVRNAQVKFRRARHVRR